MHLVLVGIALLMTETRVSSGSNGDRLGTVMDVSDRLSIVGAPAGNSGAGAAVVIYDTAVEQVLTGYLPDVGDGFGWSVAIDGDTAVVGSTGWDGFTNTEPGIGLVSVFTRSGTTWTRVAMIEAPNKADNDQFGTVVDIDDGRIVVGAPNRNHGTLYSFTGSGATWTFENSKGAMDNDANFCRYSVLLRGEEVLVGADHADTVGIYNGAAHLFALGGTSNWVLQKTFVASDPADYDRFGFSLSYDGTTVVIGAPDKGSGAAYVFTFDGSEWSEDQKIVASDGADGEKFGQSVYVDDRVMMVGCPQDGGAYVYEGAAYVFIKGTQWTEEHKLEIPPDANDKFGTSVIVSGDVVAAGTPGDGAGSVSFYNVPPKAVDMAITTHPTDIDVLELLPRVDVTVYDHYGQAYSTSVDVTVSLYNGPAGATLSGTLTVSTTDGIASFEDLEVDLSGSGYALLVRSPGLPDQVSEFFEAVDYAAVEFVILDPSDGTVDAPIDVTVRALNQFGDVDTDFQDDVAISDLGLVDIVDGEGTIQVSSTVPATMGLILVDSQSTGLDITSSQNVEFAVGAAALLEITVDPTDTEEDLTISTVSVDVTDQYSNDRVDSGTSVTVSIGSNSGGGSLTGTLTVQTVGGLASFDDLVIDEPGVGYTLVVQSPGLASDTTSTFEITATPIIPPDPPDPPEPTNDSDDSSGCLPSTGVPPAGFAVFVFFVFSLLHRT